MIREFTTILKDPGAQHAVKGLIDLFNVLVGAMYVALSVIGMVGMAIGTMIYYAEKLYHWLLKIMGFGEAEGDIKRSAKDLAVGAAERRGLKTVSVPHFATGGVFTRPTIGLFAEAGAEALVPLTNPARAAQVLEEAGLTGMMTAAGANPVNVRVFIGALELTDIVDTQVDRKMDDQARSLARGPRR